MTETKHTPGPFIYTYNECDQYHQGEILDLDGNLLAIVAGQNYGTTFGGKNRDWNPNHKEEDLEEHKANAALFAAAPVLLQALIAARKYVCAWNANSGDEETEEDLKLCNLAIKKAMEELN